jgi:hypothetical protein
MLVMAEPLHLPQALDFIPGVSEGLAVSHGPEDQVIPIDLVKTHTTMATKRPIWPQLPQLEAQSGVINTDGDNIA